MASRVLLAEHIVFTSTSSRSDTTTKIRVFWSPVLKFPHLRKKPEPLTKEWARTIIPHFPHALAHRRVKTAEWVNTSARPTEIWQTHAGLVNLKPHWWVSEQGSKVVLSPCQMKSIFWFQVMHTLTLTQHLPTILLKERTWTIELPSRTQTALKKKHHTHTITFMCVNNIYSYG